MTFSFFLLNLSINEYDVCCELFMYYWFLKALVKKKKVKSPNDKCGDSLFYYIVIKLNLQKHQCRHNFNILLNLNFYFKLNTSL